MIEELTLTLSAMFFSAQSEEFDAGMHYAFYDELHAFVSEHGRDAIREIMHLIMDGTVIIRVLCPTLRELGRIDDTPTKGARFILLTAMLYHDRPEVRDSASQGLLDMEDARAISYLDEAIEDEQYEFLRDSFAHVRDYLARCAAVQVAA